MVYAIPMYLYVEAYDPQDAANIKVKVEKMLANPLVTAAMKSADIPQRGFIVQDPQLASR